MKLVEGIDYIIEKESGLMVLTSFFLYKRGNCCGNKCANCVYEPKHLKNSKKLNESFLNIGEINNISDKNDL